MTDIEKKSYDVMEAWRAENKAHDHLHPHVAFRLGWLAGHKAAEPTVEAWGPDLSDDDIIWREETK
jgi:hypothetical protein